uniref:Uncharacterized protein n=1 Tax=Strongyloides venezuelensis TaxID=75913 RepID=A0A0K0FPR0_STRVS
MCLSSKGITEVRFIELMDGDLYSGEPKNALTELQTKYAVLKLKLSDDKVLIGMFMNFLEKSNNILCMEIKEVFREKIVKQQFTEAIDGLKIERKNIQLISLCGAELIVKDLKDTFFQALYEEITGRVPLVCKESVGTFYFNKQLKETLLENDENLKVYESILTDIIGKFRKKRETGGNSDENDI